MSEGSGVRHCLSEEVVLQLNPEPCQLEEHGGHARQSVGILGVVAVYGGRGVPGVVPLKTCLMFSRSLKKSM